MGAPYIYDISRLRVKDKIKIQTQDRPEMIKRRSKSRYTSQYWQGSVPYYSLACGGYIESREGDTSKVCKNIWLDL